MRWPSRHGSTRPRSSTRTGSCRSVIGGVPPRWPGNPGLAALAHEVATKMVESELRKARDAVARCCAACSCAPRSANDHGTWMIRAAAAEPDVVRVEVRPGARKSPAERAEGTPRARRELDRVLEHGGALPPNPDVLLPVTRTLTYRPPLPPRRGLRESRSRTSRPAGSIAAPRATSPRAIRRALAPRVEPQRVTRAIVPRVRHDAPRWAVSAVLLRRFRVLFDPPPPAAMADDRRDRAHAARPAGRAARRGRRERRALPVDRGARAPPRRGRHPSRPPRSARLRDRAARPCRSGSATPPPSSTARRSIACSCRASTGRSSPRISPRSPTRSARSCSPR